MKGIFKYPALLVLMALMYSCHKIETFPYVPPTRIVSFVLDVNDHDSTKSDDHDWGDGNDYPESTGSGVENKIVLSTVKVLAYSEDGAFICDMPVLKCFDRKDGTYDFLCAFETKTKVTVGARYKFIVLANCTSQSYNFSYKQDGTPNLDALMFASPVQNIPMWGTVTYTMEGEEDGKTLKEEQNVGNISMLRAVAKVGVKLSEELKGQGYRILELKLNYARSSGYSVPQGWDKKDNTLSLRHDEAFRPLEAEGTIAKDVNAATMGVETGAYYIYVPETMNEDSAFEPGSGEPDELSIAIKVGKWENGECVETLEFPYANGIKLREYNGGEPTGDTFNIVRNHFYDYTVTAINTSIELDLIEYRTMPWIEKEVSIDQVKFLVLNTDLVKIFNENVDATSLKFMSSSPIKSIVLKDTYDHKRSGVIEHGTDGVNAYYISKFGVPVQLGTDPGFDLEDKEELLARENAVLENISAVAEPDVLEGGITITSPFVAMSGDDVPEALWVDSHDNTIRYLEFEVTNEQDITAVFRVMQYPPMVITNIEGFFSYRDDQKLTDDQAEASHYQNYQGSYSLHLTGLYFYHEHEWSKEFEMTQEWWDSNRNERDYSWVIPQACPANQENSGCETVHYGNIGNPVTWKNASGVLQEKVYGGLYRPTQHPTDYFYRWRYNGIGASNNDSQGLSIGALYSKEEVVDGEVVTKWYRKHYVWNVNPIFYNLYVSKVYQSNGSDRLKGQADINSMTHATTTYKDEPGEGWVSWGRQSYTNHRMYHIKSMYPSSEYVIANVDLVDMAGNPTTDINQAVTANTVKNANVVSPSFMVASELGETRYQSIIASAASYKYKIPNIKEFYKLAEEHCREYVETTYEDRNNNYQWDEGEPVTHYHDWRLPTKSEIEMIIDYQMNSRTMDKVLNQQYYFCISGHGDSDDLTNIHNWVSVEVPNYKSTSTGYYIRCVRDVK